MNEDSLNYFNLIRLLNTYNVNDKIISEACLSKFLNHLWNFNEECIAFSMFDKRNPLNNEKNV